MDVMGIHARANEALKLPASSISKIFKLNYGHLRVVLLTILHRMHSMVRDGVCLHESIRCMKSRLYIISQLWIYCTYVFHTELTHLIFDPGEKMILHTLLHPPGFLP